MTDQVLFLQRASSCGNALTSHTQHVAKKRLRQMKRSVRGSIVRHQQPSRDT